MIILRTKTYSGLPVSSKDLVAEQLKMQRALMENNKKIQVLRSEEARARQRNTIQQQKMKQKRDQEIQRAIKNSEDGHSETHLYKTASQPVPPVPMKI